MLGIDLGTTFSAVATLDASGRAVTVPNSDGDILTPSAIYLNGLTAVVGQAALDVQSEQPEHVATLIKRRMGYPSFGRQVDGRDFRPETLSALILKKLVRDASARVKNLDPIVVTVPAYFDDSRRKATHDAGRIAGIRVADVFDEPCAAALTYTFDQDDRTDREKFLLVYDLGGGTFDVSIVRAARKRFHTIAIAGDVQLGGHDWDRRLVDYAADAFVAQHGSDPRSDAKSLALVESAAERAKRTLSKLPQTTVTISHAGHSLSVPITRAQFEAMTRDLLLRTRMTVNEALRQAGVGWDRIDRLLLVGGSTHMPMTRSMLRELSGKDPETGLAVSEVVARGAALHAAIRASQMAARADDLADIVEVHVNAHGLGVEVRDKDNVVNDIVIPRNTQLP
ncbi:MAG: Hsp70 family protein, partial [Gemmataceae bacterium]|nr:Hsp70 family protein [Gemmataceae bacterium]